MDDNLKQVCANLVAARRQHPAWLLLASRRAPLVLGSLASLFGISQQRVSLEDAERQLADMLANYANDTDFDLKDANPLTVARRELRGWIKRGLIVERDNELIATDGLQQALAFINDLEDRAMTSTASRLATVQREIESLAVQLDPDAEMRTAYLSAKIEALEAQIERVKSGVVDVLDEDKAAEGIRDIHSLATSLRADFRRVEDSYREADRTLRQLIVSEQRHRGDIVESLLAGHEQLLETPEGRVFHGFHEQLVRSTQIDAMQRQLRKILASPTAKDALSPPQASDLRFLSDRLLGESQSVIQARARSERDVKGFLKSGLAVEHHRVGNLLNDLLEQAASIDWSNATLRRSKVPMPPVAIAAKAFPVIARLRFKDINEDPKTALNLDAANTRLQDIDDDFWAAFDTLDQGKLLRDTLALLQRTDQAMSIAELYIALSPRHELEAIALWLTAARELKMPLGDARETLTVPKDDHSVVQFRLPKLAFEARTFATLSLDP